MQGFYQFLKKTIKTPHVSAAVYDLTCCPSVLCLKASFRTARKPITVLYQNSAATAEKTKKTGLSPALSKRRGSTKVTRSAACKASEPSAQGIALGLRVYVCFRAVSAKAFGFAFVRHDSAKRASTMALAAPSVALVGRSYSCAILPRALPWADSSLALLSPLRSVIEPTGRFQNVVGKESGRAERRPSFFLYHPVLRTPLLPGRGDHAGCFFRFFQKLICVTRGGLVTLRAPSPFGEGWGEARMYVCSYVFVPYVFFGRFTTYLMFFFSRR